MTKFTGISVLLTPDEMNLIQAALLNHFDRLPAETQTGRWITVRNKLFRAMERLYTLNKERAAQAE